MFENSATRLGFGTYSLTGKDGVDAISAAIDIGYRHVDTATLYENQREVGEAIERAEVGREELVVATKVGHFEESAKTPEYVRDAVGRSFELLGVDTIDLLYHHWPRTRGEIREVLPVIEEFVAEGAVRHLGVSNYRIEDLELASELLEIPVAVNQVEMHPLLPQTELREYLAGTGTTLVAYSPIAQGAVFDVPEIETVADAHDTSEATVSLAWALEKGVVPIPRTSDPDHARTNFEALELELDDEDVDRIDSIDRTHRCEDPAWMEW